MNSGKVLELFDEVRGVLIDGLNLIRFLVFLQIFEDESFDSLMVLERLEDIDHVCELVESAAGECLPNQRTIVIRVLKLRDRLLDHVQPIDQFIFEQLVELGLAHERL